MHHSITAHIYLSLDHNSKIQFILGQLSRNYSIHWVYQTQQPTKKYYIQNKSFFSQSLHFSLEFID